MKSRGRGWETFIFHLDPSCTVCASTLEGLPLFISKGVKWVDRL